MSYHDVWEQHHKTQSNCTETLPMLFSLHNVVVFHCGTQTAIRLVTRTCQVCQKEQVRLLSVCERCKHESTQPCPSCGHPRGRTEEKYLDIPLHRIEDCVEKIQRKALMQARSQEKKNNCIIRNNHQIPTVTTIECLNNVILSSRHTDSMEEDSLLKSSKPVSKRGRKRKLPKNPELYSVSTTSVSIDSKSNRQLWLNRDMGGSINKNNSLVPPTVISTNFTLCSKHIDSVEINSLKLSKPVSKRGRKRKVAKNIELESMNPTSQHLANDKTYSCCGSSTVASKPSHQSWLNQMNNSNHRSPLSLDNRPTAALTDRGKCTRKSKKSTHDLKETQYQTNSLKHSSDNSCLMASLQSSTSGSKSQVALTYSPNKVSSENHYGHYGETSDYNLRNNCRHLTKYSHTSPKQPDVITEDEPCLPSKQISQKLSECKQILTNATCKTNAHILPQKLDNTNFVINRSFSLKNHKKKPYLNDCLDNLLPQPNISPICQTRTLDEYNCDSHINCSHPMSPYISLNKRSEANKSAQSGSPARETRISHNFIKNTPALSITYNKYLSLGDNQNPLYHDVSTHNAVPTQIAPTERVLSVSNSNVNDLSCNRLLIGSNPFYCNTTYSGQRKLSPTRINRNLSFCNQNVINLSVLRNGLVNNQSFIKSNHGNISGRSNIRSSASNENLSVKQISQTDSLDVLTPDQAKSSLNYQQSLQHGPLKSKPSFPFAFSEKSFNSSQSLNNGINKLFDVKSISKNSLKINLSNANNGIDQRSNNPFISNQSYDNTATKTNSEPTRTVNEDLNLSTDINNAMIGGSCVSDNPRFVELNDNVSTNSSQHCKQLNNRSVNCNVNITPTPTNQPALYTNAAMSHETNSVVYNKSTPLSFSTLYSPAINLIPEVVTSNVNNNHDIPVFGHSDSIACHNYNDMLSLNILNPSFGNMSTSPRHLQNSNSSKCCGLDTPEVYDLSNNNNKCCHRESNSQSLINATQDDFTAPPNHQCAHISLVSPVQNYIDPVMGQSKTIKCSCAHTLGNILPSLYNTGNSFHTEIEKADKKNRSNQSAVIACNLLGTAHSIDNLSSESPLSSTISTKQVISFDDCFSPDPASDIGEQHSDNDHVTEPIHHQHYAHCSLHQNLFAADSIYASQQCIDNETSLSPSNNSSQTQYTYFDIHNTSMVNGNLPSTTQSLKASLDKSLFTSNAHTVPSNFNTKFLDDKSERDYTDEEQSDLDSKYITDESSGNRNNADPNICINTYSMTNNSLVDNWLSDEDYVTLDLQETDYLSESLDQGDENNECFDKLTEKNETSCIQNDNAHSINQSNSDNVNHSLTDQSAIDIQQYLEFRTSQEPNTESTCKEHTSNIMNKSMRQSGDGLTPETLVLTQATSSSMVTLPPTVETQNFWTEGTIDNDNNSGSNDRTELMTKHTFGTSGSSRVPVLTELLQRPVQCMNIPRHPSPNISQLLRESSEVLHGHRVNYSNVRTSENISQPYNSDVTQLAEAAHDNDGNVHNFCAASELCTDDLAHLSGHQSDSTEDVLVHPCESQTAQDDDWLIARSETVNNSSPGVIETAFTLANSESPDNISWASPLCTDIYDDNITNHDMVTSFNQPLTSGSYKCHQQIEQFLSMLNDPDSQLTSNHHRSQITPSGASHSQIDAIASKMSIMVDQWKEKCLLSLRENYDRLLDDWRDSSMASLQEQYDRLIEENTSSKYLKRRLDQLLEDGIRFALNSTSNDQPVKSKPKDITRFIVRNVFRDGIATDKAKINRYKRSKVPRSKGYTSRLLSKTKNLQQQAGTILEQYSDSVGTTLEKCSDSDRNQDLNIHEAEQSSETSSSYSENTANSQDNENIDCDKVSSSNGNYDELESTQNCVEEEKLSEDSMDYSNSDTTIASVNKSNTADMVHHEASSSEIYQGCDLTDEATGNSVDHIRERGKGNYSQQANTKSYADDNTATHHAVSSTAASKRAKVLEMGEVKDEVDVAVLYSRMYLNEDSSVTEIMTVFNSNMRVYDQELSTLFDEIVVDDDHCRAWQHG